MELFDFKEQLVIGDRGENQFVDYYPNFRLKKSEDRRYDFISGNGKTIELKTDTYDMDKTPNFFMELHSDMKVKSLGGPWRAEKDNVDYFVYYFIKNKTLFWFRVKDMFPVLLEYIRVNKPRTKFIPNKGWNAEGYAIPRAALASVEFRKDIF